MKRRLAVLLVVVLLLGCVNVSFCAVAAENTFIPVLRFVASSDTHVQSPSNKNARRIGAMMRLAYKIADSDTAYSAVDALLVAGDLTDKGSIAQFNKFQAAVNVALRRGTKFLGVVARSHDGVSMSYEKMRNYYAAISGNQPDFHTVIGGYHFIGVSGSSSPDGPSVYNDESQVQWLKEQLDAAVEDTPDKPIFVMHHEHVRNTVYGSSDAEGWGAPYFAEVLQQYPQVVDFSGHSHYPLNDPRSLWQGAYTAVGTGAIYYTEMRDGDGNTYHPDGYKNVATCWIVEADAQGNLRLRGMDISAKTVLCEYFLKNPADPANRDYTPAKRKAASKAPVFPADAEVTCSANGRTCALTVPTAQSADGMPVVIYRAVVIDEAGETQATGWAIPPYYMTSAQREITLQVSDVPDGTYTVRVTAETAYGVSSQALETTWTVTGDAPASDDENAFLRFFRQIGQWFQSLFAKITDWFRG